MIPRTRSILIGLSLLFLAVVESTGQAGFVSGRVIDTRGNPIAGAIVRHEMLRTGAYTTLHGHFSLRATTGDQLMIKSVGMVTQRYTVGDILDSIVIIMTADTTIGSELVVTALGLTNTRRALGYEVQSLTGAEMRASGQNDIVTSLSSRISGLEVISSSGTPGAAVFMRLRGMSSINGDNQPLIIIDGIPIDNEQINSANLLGSVMYSNRVLDIDPNTIEDVQVLKGATATALYGIRAANGAIIITTRRGRAPLDKGIAVSATMSLAHDVVTATPPLQSLYSQGDNGLYAHSSVASRSYGARLDTLFYDGVPSTFDRRGSIVGKSSAPANALPVLAIDPLDGLFQTGQTRSQSVTLQTADAGSSLVLTISNLETKGIIPLSSWNRRSVTANSSVLLTNNFRMSSKLSYTNTGGQRSQQGANPSGVMLAALRTPPSFDNRNGRTTAEALNQQSDAYITPEGRQRSYRQGVGFDNPYWSITQNHFRDAVNRLLGSFEFTYTPIEDLDILFRSGLDYYLDDRVQTFARNSNAAPSGRFFNDVYEVSNLSADLIATLRQKLSESISVRAVLGANVFSRGKSGHLIQADGLGNVDAPLDPNNYQSGIVRQSLQLKRTAAVYSDVQLDYQNMIFLSLTGRNEWSTTLPVPNNSFFYPSASTAIILTEVLPDLASSTLPFVKLRMSYASVGNDAPVQATTSGYISSSFRDFWTSGIRFPFQNSIGFTIENRLCSPELSPERTTSFEYGVDLSLLDRRIDLSFTSYVQISDRQIFTVPIPASSGFSRLLANGGAVSNRGFEFTLKTQNFKNALIQWNTTVNATHNVNMVDALRLTPQYTLGGFEGASIRVIEGEPYGSIYGFAWKRDAQGRRIINDDTTSNSYGYPMRDEFERGFDNYNPEWIFGLGNQLQVGPFALAMQVESRLGVFMWNGTRAVMTFFGTHKQTEDREQLRVFEGVKSSNGQPNDIPVPTGEYWYVFGAGTGSSALYTENFIEDASWVRIRSASLSWEVPLTLLLGTPLKRVNVALTGTNLWYFTRYTGVDPETSLAGATNIQGLDYFNGPGTRTYAFSITVGL